MTAQDTAGDGRVEATTSRQRQRRRVTAGRALKGATGLAAIVAVLSGGAALGEEPGEAGAPAQKEGFSQSVGPEVVTFDPADTDLLLSVGWQAPAAAIDDGFDDHAARLRTFVAIAAALGLGPEVGAMQANCGTPQELGTADMVIAREGLAAAQAAGADELAALARHRVDAELVLAEIRDAAPGLSEGESVADTIAALETEIASVDARLPAVEAEQAVRAQEIAALDAAIQAAVAEVLPALDGPAAWQFANLDVTADGVVDADDLTAALERADAALPGSPAAAE